MPLQSLSPQRRSAKPLLLLRTCLLLIQLLLIYLCKLLIQIIKVHTLAHYWQKSQSESLLMLQTILFDCSERVFEPVRFVTAWSGACMDSGNWNSLGRFLSGQLSSHPLPHCHSLGMMTCLPLDFLTPPVWRHSLTTQVNFKTLCYYILLGCDK